MSAVDEEEVKNFEETKEMQLWKASLSETMKQRFQGFQLTKEYLRLEKEKKKRQELDSQPVLHFIQQIPFVPPPPPPPANEEHLNDDDEAVDVFYEADNTTRSKTGQKEEKKQVNPVTDPLKAHLEINVSTAIQLQKLDEEQRQTLADLQFYAQEQRALTEKLMEQERMLQLVQRDISERENLIQFVFKERLESMASATNLHND